MLVQNVLHLDSDAWNREMCVCGAGEKHVQKLLWATSQVMLKHLDQGLCTHLHGFLALPSHSVTSTSCHSMQPAELLDHVGAHPTPHPPKHCVLSARMEELDEGS